MKRQFCCIVMLLLTLCCLGGCGQESNQERVEKILLDSDVRVFYPVKWYVEKGTIADGALQQDLLIALGDANRWKKIKEKEYEEVSSRATDAWYQFGSTTVNGAILLQPYSDVDYIRMDYEGEQFYFVAEENPTKKLIPLLENNGERIALDVIK